ncbi:MAG: T9SS type A sorting domain-containing protein [Bacteroidales bacterium]|nr:T9SS type A sorting domain-containing protein [Bacteroidales bacterium]
MRNFVFLAAAVFAAQAASASSLIVEAIDGTSQAYPMESVSRVDFTTAGSIKVVGTDGTVDTKSISATRKLVFSDFNAPATSAAESQASKLGVFPNPVSNELTVVGAESDILLFSAGGNLVSRTKADGKTVISVGSLADGIYVLHSGNSAVRVIKSK